PRRPGCRHRLRRKGTNSTRRVVSCRAGRRDDQPGSAADPARRGSAATGTTPATIRSVPVVPKMTWFRLSPTHVDRPCLPMFPVLPKGGPTQAGRRTHLCSAPLTNLRSGGGAGAPPLLFFATRCRARSASKGTLSLRRRLV